MNGVVMVAGMETALAKQHGLLTEVDLATASVDYLTPSLEKTKQADYIRSRPMWRGTLSQYPLVLL